MHAIARLADRGPTAAAAIAALLLVAAIWLPAVLPGAALFAVFFVVGSAAVVAFVILRRGERAALQVVGICIGLLVVLSLALYGSVVQVPLVASVFWLPAIVAAMVLRRSVSLDLAMLVVIACGALVALGTDMVAGDGEPPWREPLAAQLEAAGAAEGLSPEQVDVLVENLSNMMSGAMGVSVMSVALAALFLARYWQAAMVRPGGFRDEFHALSLGRTAALLCLLVIALSMLLGGQPWGALAIVAVFAFFVQGLAVAHAIVRQRGLAKGWLVGLYVLLLLPHTLLLLAALGIADELFHLRRTDGPTA